MKKVFISYSYNDPMARQLARFLNEHLPSLGAEPITVSDAVELGGNWQMGITEEINRCSVFVCFIQRDNSNVMFELGYALAKNKKIILVGDFELLPADLRSMIYVPREAHPYDVLMHIENVCRGNLQNRCLPTFWIPTAPKRQFACCSIVQNFWTPSGHGSLRNSQCIGSYRKDSKFSRPVFQETTVMTCLLSLSEEAEQ